MPFKKGVITNPQGASRNIKRLQKQLKEQLIKFVPGAVEALGKMLKDPDHQEFAVKEIFDRVYGRAAQSVEVSGHITQFSVMIESQGGVVINSTPKTVEHDDGES